MAVIAAFPNLEHGGPRPAKQRKLPPNYEAVLVKHTYEDEGISVNRAATTATQDYELTYNLLTTLEAKILDDHHDLAFGEFNHFPYRDRDGVLHPITRYLKYESDHTGRVQLTQTRMIVLRAYPA